MTDADISAAMSCGHPIGCFRPKEGTAGGFLLFRQDPKTHGFCIACHEREDGLREGKLEAMSAVNNKSYLITVERLKMPQSYAHSCIVCRENDGLSLVGGFRNSNAHGIVVCESCLQDLGFSDRRMVDSGVGLSKSELDEIRELVANLNVGNGSKTELALCAAVKGDMVKLLKEVERIYELVRIPDESISEVVSGLEYIASSPTQEHGGFHPKAVAIAKEAIKTIYTILGIVTRSRGINGL